MKNKKKVPNRYKNANTARESENNDNFRIFAPAPILKRYDAVLADLNENDRLFYEVMKNVSELLKKEEVMKALPSLPDYEIIIENLHEYEKMLQGDLAELIGMERRDRKKAVRLVKTIMVHALPKEDAKWLFAQINDDLDLQNAVTREAATFTEWKREDFQKIEIGGLTPFSSQQIAEMRAVMALLLGRQEPTLDGARKRLKSRGVFREDGSFDRERALDIIIMSARSIK